MSESKVCYFVGSYGGAAAITFARLVSAYGFQLVVADSDSLPKALTAAEVPHQRASLAYAPGSSHSQCIDLKTVTSAAQAIVVTDQVKLVNQQSIVINSLLSGLVAFPNVAVVTSAEDCEAYFGEVNSEGIASDSLKRKLAAKACKYIAEASQLVAETMAASPEVVHSPKKQVVLVIGSGGREHAIVHKLAASIRVKSIFVAPGNFGTAMEMTSECPVTNVDVNTEDISTVVGFVQENDVDFVVVGPEQPLVDGLVDALLEKGTPCFGPSKAAAVLEASKAWSKDFMQRHSLPTAEYRTFTDFSSAETYLRSIPHKVVVKASGLAAGKGVLIPTDTKEAVAAARDILQNNLFGSAGAEIVIEQFLEGQEVSVLAFCDGKLAVGMPPAQDHKRARDGDEGLNTGGMGAYAPTPVLSPAVYAECVDIVQRTVDAMAAEGRPYKGVLYAGFILNPEEQGGVRPMLLEYNCRFGDPETQVILPLLHSDLFDIMQSCVSGNLTNGIVQWRPSGFACTVVCAAPGYPESYPKGMAISGLKEAAGLEDVKVYHAGTKASIESKPLTNGGRVLAITGVGESLKTAVDRAYSGINSVSFDGMHRRTDIAKRGLMHPLKIGVLGSTRGTDMQAIIDAIARMELNAKIVMVISNRSGAGILDKARNHGIPSIAIGAKGKSRESYDWEVTQQLQRAGVELVLMVGYMRIVSPYFVHVWRDRCLNVHPSLLPEFAGGMDTDVHKDVLASKKEKTGCTIHFVTEEVDGGPIVVQLACDVEYPGDTPDSLKAKVQQLEGMAYIQAIQMFIIGKIGPSLGKGSCSASSVLTYRAAGVDIDAGEALVDRIKPFCKATIRSGCDAELGGFGGLFDLAKAGYAGDDTVLVSGTDGVGTKLKIAQATKKHNTIGIDLVAMCVNDILVCGAEPLFFLDYYATGALQVDEAASVVSGIAEGCLQSGCALIGGETAEMAGMYSKGEYDLAGFSVGAVRRSHILPRNIAEGDILLGLSSSGVHSNGYSLVRKCVEKSGLSWDSSPPFESDLPTLADALLTPTRIYVKALLPLIKEGLLEGLAHITGGGLLDNVPRVLQSNQTAVVDLETSGWKLPPVFKWLRNIANLPQDEMLRTFNCGIGMVLVVKADNVNRVMEMLSMSADPGIIYQLGSIEARSPNSPQVSVKGILM